MNIIGKALDSPRERLEQIKARLEAIDEGLSTALLNDNRTNDDLRFLLDLIEKQVDGDGALPMVGASPGECKCWRGHVAMCTCNCDCHARETP